MIKPMTPPIAAPTTAAIGETSALVSSIGSGLIETLVSRDSSSLASRLSAEILYLRILFCNLFSIERRRSKPSGSSE